MYRMKLMVAEISTLIKINHPNIVNLLSFTLDTSKNDATAILAFEYAHNGDLHGFLVKCKYLDEKITKSILRMIIHALQHLQTKSIVHRDIKPKNILLDHNYQPKVSDFGLCIDANININAIPFVIGKNSYRHQSIKVSRACGTKGYMAPEAHQGNVSSAGDVFSIGIMAYNMLIGSYGDDKYKETRKPFTFKQKIVDDNSNYVRKVVGDELYKKIQHGEYGQYWDALLDKFKTHNMPYRRLSPQFRKWFLKMVQFEPKDRPNYYQLLDSEWMKKDGFYRKYELRNELKRIDDGQMDRLTEYSGSIDNHKLFDSARDVVHDEKVDDIPHERDGKPENIKHPFFVIVEIDSVESKHNSNSDVCGKIKNIIETELNHDLIEYDINNNKSNICYGINMARFDRAIISSNYDNYNDHNDFFDCLIFICICPGNKGVADGYIVDKNNDEYLLYDLLIKNDYVKDKPKICIFNSLQIPNQSMSTTTTTTQSSDIAIWIQDIAQCGRFYCDNDLEVLSIVNVLCDSLAIDQSSLDGILNMLKREKEEKEMKYKCIFENREEFYIQQLNSNNQEEKP